MVCGLPSRSLLKNEDRNETPWLIDGVADAPAPKTREAVEALMRTGALFRYVGDVKVYRCPSQYELPWMPDLASDLQVLYRWLSPYGIVRAMNGVRPSYRAKAEATFVGAHGPSRIRAYMTKLSELSPPGPAYRMVFLDVGCADTMDVLPADQIVLGSNVTRSRGWTAAGAGAPIHHNNGTTMSFADGSVRYWKWKDPRTIAYTQSVLDYYDQGGTAPRRELPPDPDNPDYLKFHQAVWGRL